MRAILSEVVVLAVAMVFLGAFTMSFKSEQERQQIISRWAAAARPLAQLLDPGRHQS